MKSGVHPGLYSRWKSMIHRCMDLNNPDYGGRGITVCTRWLTYENYAADVGEPPHPDAQLDREDNSLGYFKENCRWVTRQVNQNNCRQYKNNTTGISGVSWHKQRQCWVAYSKLSGGRQQSLYTGQDFFLACCARKSYESKQLHASIRENVS